MSTFVYHESSVGRGPNPEAFLDEPVDEYADVSTDDPFPTWQIIPYIVLRYAAIALSVYAAVRVLA